MNKTSRTYKDRTLFRTITLMRTKFTFMLLIIITCLGMLSGCGVMNLGRYKGIEWTAKDEQYYKVKELVLSSGSMGKPRTEFDHTMQDAVVLTFIAAQEPNKYQSKVVWVDPSNVIYKTDQKTYDVVVENKTAEERNPKGTPHVHSISTKELYDHKPGLWTVKFYLDNALVRRLTFTVM